MGALATWLRPAVPGLWMILAGCAAPSLPPWLAEPRSPLPLEGWEAGGAEVPPAEPRPRKSLRDPDALLWRASAGFWKPSLSGDGWYRGKSADGVDTGGTGGGAGLGVRHPVLSGRSAGDPASARAPQDGSPEWVRFVGGDIATFSGRAESGADSGRLGAVDLVLAGGAAHMPSGRRSPDFLAEVLLGARRASIALDGDALAAAGAEESRASTGVLFGLNLEASPKDGFTLFGRIDGSISGSSDSDEVGTVHAFAGFRASLGDHLSLEGGWRYYRMDVTLRESRTYVIVIIPVTETETTQESSLSASGPWLGLVYDF